MERKTIRTITGLVFGWEIREYRLVDGTGGGTTFCYDAAERDGLGLSPDFDTYDEAVAYVVRGTQAARQLREARRNDDTSALRRAFA